MNEPNSPFNKFILESAEQYIQTVVLIDDRIFEHKTGRIAQRLKKPSGLGRKPALKSVHDISDEIEKTTEISTVDEEPNEISFQDVQTSFAKKRIICSLYQPKKSASFSDRSDVYNLCSTSDVIIVDWEIYGDAGQKATELVGSLIETSMKDIPHQLRLILIYTLEMNLLMVANEVYEDLKRRIGAVAINIEEDSEGLVLITENARVVVLGKQINKSYPQFSKHFVAANKLAERTIFEFSRLASGLLQSIVLRGIATLRENNRRILMRFNENLDLAFMTHRALLLPDEALTQILPLMTDELRAVLEDRFIEGAIGPPSNIEQIVADWCANRWSPGIKTTEFIGPVNPREFAKEVFCKGLGIKQTYSPPPNDKIRNLINCIKEIDGYPFWDNHDKCLKLTEYLLGNRQQDFCHEKLSSLMSQRIRYGNVPRKLHLGVILREMGGEGRYLICLQPLCDSVRLNGQKRPFVFCYLESPNNGKKITHSIVDSKNNLIQLLYKPRILNCFISIFTSTTDAMLAVEDEKSQFIFIDDNRNEYEWIAELKPEQAQRAAEEFGRTLTRVGLTESEWLRLKAK